jgi:hypothetical protein
MIQLSYISKQTYPLSNAEVRDILQRSVSNNSSKGITGMLIFYRGTFLQVLEGDQKLVTELYERLRLDRRHKEVQLIDKKEVNAPSFSSWGMGFVDVQEIFNNGDRDFVSYFVDAAAEQAKNPNEVSERIERIIERFKHGAWRNYIQ